MARESEQLDERLDNQRDEPLIMDEATPDERPTQVHRSVAPQAPSAWPTSNGTAGTGAPPAIVPVVAPSHAATNTAIQAPAPHNAPTYADLSSVADGNGATDATALNGARIDVAHSLPQPAHASPPQQAEAPYPQTPPAQPAPGEGRYTHVPWEAASSWGTSTLNGANTAAGMSYLFWWVSGLIVYFNERHNRYVRFHAVQSILWTGLLTIVSVVLYIAAEIFGDIAAAAHQPWIAHVFQPLVFLGYLGVIGLWIWPMVAAWNGHYLRIPILGEYAERYAAPPREPYPGPPPF